jgi:hypothetical protein
VYELIPKCRDAVPFASIRINRAGLRGSDRRQARGRFRIVAFGVEQFGSARRTTFQSPSVARRRDSVSAERAARHNLFQGPEPAARAAAELT